MRNPIKIIRKMSRQWVPRGDIEFKVGNLEKIVENAGLVLKTLKLNKRIFYKVQSIEARTLFISGEEEECKFLAIGDLHAGFKLIDLNALRATLQRAKDKGVKYCLISGDIHEGMNIYFGQKLLVESKLPEKQSQIIFNILKDFDFTYVIIDGNHDLSFNANGLENPNEILMRKLSKIGIKAYYLKTFVANVIIGGVCIRLVHLDDHYGDDGEIPCLKYQKKVIEHPFVEYNGYSYLVACIQAGHVHKYGCWDTIRFDYSGKKPRERSKSEIKELTRKVGYQPLIVLQPGTIKKHLIDERPKFGFITKISINKRGIPRSYEIL